MEIIETQKTITQLEIKLSKLNVLNHDLDWDYVRSKRLQFRSHEQSKYNFDKILNRELAKTDFKSIDQNIYLITDDDYTFDSMTNSFGPSKFHILDVYIHNYVLEIGYFDLEPTISNKNKATFFEKVAHIKQINDIISPLEQELKDSMESNENRYSELRKLLNIDTLEQEIEYLKENINNSNDLLIKTIEFDMQKHNSIGLDFTTKDKYKKDQKLLLDNNKYSEFLENRINLEKDFKASEFNL